jgi:hypothetical protein
MLLSTNRLPVLSAVDESTAVIGEAEQVKLNVLLLKSTALAPYPVPAAEARWSTGLKSRIEFCASADCA